MIKGGSLHVCDKMDSIITILDHNLKFPHWGMGCQSKPVGDSPLPANGYKAEISIKNPPASLKASSTAVIKTTVKNTSEAPWPALGQSSVRLSYHWLSSDGKTILDEFDGLRTTLPADLMPNKEIELEAKIKAPNKPGNYILEFDMLQEIVSWFKEKGSKTSQINIKVE